MGGGRLVEALDRTGWNVIGIDLSGDHGRPGQTTGPPISASRCWSRRSSAPVRGRRLRRGHGPRRARVHRGRLAALWALARVLRTGGMAVAAGPTSAAYTAWRRAHRRSARPCRRPPSPLSPKSGSNGATSSWRCWTPYGLHAGADDAAQPAGTSLGSVRARLAAQLRLRGRGSDRNARAFALAAVVTARRRSEPGSGTIHDRGRTGDGAGPSHPRGLVVALGRRLRLRGTPSHARRSRGFDRTGRSREWPDRYGRLRRRRRARDQGRARLSRMVSRSREAVRPARRRRPQQPHSAPSRWTGIDHDRCRNRAARAASRATGGPATAAESSALHGVRRGSRRRAPDSDTDNDRARPCGRTDVSRPSLAL